ncbi:hypothetical protein NIES22_55480 [Calothrix brevissima NIES-22]|nr:hypothetical protein NIES22_55480 [Calothrix brevissima NIES-22]
MICEFIYFQTGVSPVFFIADPTESTLTIALLGVDYPTFNIGMHVSLDIAMFVTRKLYLFT